ncbi:interferon-induced very large GTPase 1-like [Apostichopus japonicus]|uniref:interferon-induced very large GTPase 1-like n=1 Tax=Stichopus japonicus TaxID=307972 RepID=UPI003AB5F865
MEDRSTTKQNAEATDSGHRELSPQVIYVTGLNKKHSIDINIVNPCRPLARLSYQIDEIPFLTEHSLTRNFFDIESEQLFMSLCAKGHENTPENMPTPVTEDEWEKVEYMSKIKLSWHVTKKLETTSEHLLQLTADALCNLQNISKKFASTDVTSINKDVNDDIVSFFKSFGSHVSLGPFEVGGRCFLKVSSSGIKSGCGKLIWDAIERDLNDLNPNNVDSCSAGGDTHFICIENENNPDRDYVELCRQIKVFEGGTLKSDVGFRQYKNDLSKTHTVVQGSYEDENLVPVWNILKNHGQIFAVLCDSLRNLLEASWTSCKDVTDLHKSTEGPSSCDTAFPQTLSPEKSVFEILNIVQRDIGIVEATSVRRDAYEIENTSKNAFWKFMTAINSLDFRGRKYVQLPSEILENISKSSKAADFDIFDSVDVTRSESEEPNNIMSAMDLTFAALHSCDPFLKQEILSKMAACRLAVPLLLPSLQHQTEVQLLLWGLRKIYKSWKPINENTPIEKSVIEHEIPIVSFLRFGDIGISKSKLLNKVVGKLQGNSDHPYFVDCDEEPSCAKLSKGTVETFWFLPESTGSEEDANSRLLDAITFLNLRGNAFEFPKQRKFALLASDVVVLLVKEETFLRNRSQIKEMKVTKHLLCVVTTENPQKQGDVLRKDNVTILFSKAFLLDIGSDICKELNLVLWEGHVKQKQEQFRSIRSLQKFCKDLQIVVDDEVEGCVAGKNIAAGILSNVKKCPEDYKKVHLPLQSELWSKYAGLDKKWSKRFDNKFPTVEHFHDDLKRQMREVREQQLNTQPTDDILNLIEALNQRQPSEISRYFLAWLEFFLNDLSQEKLTPLRKQLRDIQRKSRELNTQKSKLKDNPKQSKDYVAELKWLNDEDIKLLQDAQQVTACIDKNSLGIEHFMRELGQRYEAYEELKLQNGTNVDSKINEVELPKIAATLLINGYTLEILDGDVGRVPIKWVQAVLASATEQLGNPKVCAVSVLGIQSSGKSTLLNCMFGVKFAVSAGRCTRGVFIQLLKVHKELQTDTRFEYLIVIDTEGLKAPERSFHEDFRHDNELATFALCLADSTIINIAGQTVGKDMTDVLQIAAHAFIRMREVNIDSSCRLVQQFVADLAAVEKNEACTQAILTSLDEAVAAAANAEGYGYLYTRFSDVFNLKSNENVQYIPSLWQGAMAPPNHRYSEKIMMLRKIIIDDLKETSRTLRQFSERTTNIWNAVKEENFIFSFQNCVTALRYKTFQHTYGQWVIEMRQKTMESESDAQQKLRNVPKTFVSETKQTLLEEINHVVDEECSRLEALIRAYLKNNVEHNDDQLHKFEDEFLHDLELTGRTFKQDARDALNRVEESIHQLDHMDHLLPVCRNQLREMARQEALAQRGNIADLKTLENMSNEQIRQTFETLWEDWIKEICASYPSKTVEEEEVRREVYSYVFQVGEKRDLLKDGLMKRLKVKFAQGGPNQTGIKDNVDKIVGISLAILISDIENDFAFEPSIIKQLIDTSVVQLNSNFDGTLLSQDTKIKVLEQVCNQAVPIIYEGRCKYNEKYSLRELLTKEKKNLWEDFNALFSSAFQDTRASASVTRLLYEKLADRIKCYLGPAIFKAVREDCPYFASKFKMFGQLLEDMAINNDFQDYYNFILDLPTFLEDWSLRKIAEVCVSTTQNKSFVEVMVEEEVQDIIPTLLEIVHSTVSLHSKQPINENNGSESEYSIWIKNFFKAIKENVETLHISDDDVKTILLFDVKELSFFTDQIKNYLKDDIESDIKDTLGIPRSGCIQEAERMLRALPTKPQAEIARHVSGCTAQCPICHAPCDNMTAQHEKHRAELHFPEGLVGTASKGSERLLCNICTSSVTSNDTYWEGNVKQKYRDYQTHFPDWIIQPVRDQSPVKYWKWVMNNFNEDFAKMYGRKEANIPLGWIEITREEAIQDLRNAYVLREVS